MPLALQGLRCSCNNCCTGTGPERYLTFVTWNIAVDSELREKLLTTIKGGKDDEIEKALRALSEQNPTKGPARSDKLFGKWKLLWASPNSEVAKATKRNPLPSYSEQRIGIYLHFSYNGHASMPCLFSPHGACSCAKV